MIISPGRLRRDQARMPGTTGNRIVLDPRGIHHKIIPSKSFQHSVANHAEQKGLSVAESLFVVQKLKTLEAVGPYTRVEAHAAVYQAFHGTAGHEACHTLPCQLVLDNRFPHHLLTSKGQGLNDLARHRIIQLSARCTWQPAIVNSVDTVLDWDEASDFVSLYLQSVDAVLQGAEPVDAYRGFCDEKRRTLRRLMELVQDVPISEEDAVMLISAAPSPPSAEQVRQLLGDKTALGLMQHQREVIIETYADQARTIPNAVMNGDLKNEVQKEAWVDQ